MTADTLGGVWTYAMELIRSLEPHHVEVALVARGREPNREQREEANALRNCELYTLPQKLEWMDDPWHDVEEAQDALRRLVDDVTPDVLHFNDYGAAVAGWELPVVLTAHSCVYSWFQAVKGGLPSQEWQPYRNCVRQALENATVVTAPTKEMLRGLAVYDADVQDARVFANGRSSTAFVRNAQKQPLILAAGRVWDEAKNLSVLHPAGRKLSWPIYVAGETEHPSYPEQREPQTALRCLGNLGPLQMRQVLAAASIFAHPARYEPFGLAPLEAALAGCALVLGDIPSLHEVWGDAALYVPCDAPEAWCLTLRQLIYDAPRRAEMARRAQARARRYSAEAFGEAYASLYAEFPSRESTHEKASATTFSRAPFVPSPFQPPFG
ncbi:MAG: glycosyltransferase family 4 protein [Verrucomicrobiota bacterium JB022]|nr:glycosyltransferase family 4 protein [Verrucomicrobiota bacterium JB022]